MTNTPLRILFLAAEVEPFARTGGLAEVAGALPLALQALGHDVRVAMPRYGHIDLERWQLRCIVPEYSVAMGQSSELAALYMTTLPDSTLPVWMIDNPRLFGTPEMYLGDQDAERFIFWARATIEALRLEQWVPDIIHANDWHAAIVANWLRTSLRRDPFFRSTACIYTIHTLAYRGVFGQRVLEMAGVAEYGFVVHPGLPQLNRMVDLMSRGIYYADIITTVSPSHAREILTPEFGEGLDPLLRDRRDRLFGVLNGLDYTRYDPATDPQLVAPYSVADLAGKAINKRQLQQQLGLPERPETPLFCFVGRLNEQKGLGLIQDVLEMILAHSACQFIVAGTGEERFHSWLEAMQQRYPQQVRALFTFNDPLLRQMCAGSDGLLMPSLVEPGGTNQLLALRYGTLPIARATGGLSDTIEDMDTYAQRGTGFLFKDAQAQALYGTLMRALEMYRHHELWQQAVRRAMTADWSWQRSAEHYNDIYQRAIASRQTRRPHASYRAP